MKLYLKISQEIKNILYGIRSAISPVQKKVHINLPYVCQFATAEHAEPSLRKELQTIDDDSWAETGATTKERYVLWAFTMCGMASLLMILKYFKKDGGVKVVELAEDALRSGVYEDEDGVISNMKYREFAVWVRKYGVRADVSTKLHPQGIYHALSKGCPVIVSVNPNIRGFITAPVGQKGGHLVVVTGYDRAQGTISINNPSGFTSTHTQINHTMNVEDFLKYYAGRGIVISNIG